MPMLRVNTLGQNEALCRWDGFHPIDSGGVFALVVLRDPPHSKKSCSSGFHQQLLQFVDGLDIAMLTGLKDAFLYAIDMLLELAPGQFVPSFTRRVKRLLVSGCLRVGYTTHTSFFPVIVPTSAYPLAFPEALAFWGILLAICIWVVPSSSYRQPMRAGCRVSPFP